MKEIVFPNPACAAICRNAMNEICIEDCSPKKDCSQFELREDLTISEMPRYPDTSGMTWKERFIIEEAYTKKIVDYLQGKDTNVYTTDIPRRSFSDRRGYSEDPKGESCESIQRNARDEILENRSKHPSTTV